ncbi:MAG: hypothetical protein D6737_12925, partial [Chloroflexi bacterium]
MKKFLIVILVFILLVSAVPFAGLHAQDDELPPLPEDFGTIRMGYIPILAFAPYFVAKDKGYFEDLGLDVELELFRSGDPMIAPLSLGQLDVGGGEIGPALINAVNAGLDVRVVGGHSSQPPGFGAVPLIVRDDLVESGEVTSVADLAGKRLAINIERGVAEYLLNSALSQFGLSIDDVEIVAIPFPEMPAALANDAIDGAILPHPLAGQPLASGEGVVLMNGDEVANNPQNGVIYFGKRMLEEENREVAVRFLMAFLMAARDMQDGEDYTFRDDPEIVSTIAAWTGVPEAAVQNGVAYYVQPNGQINRDSFIDIMTYHVTHGYTETDEVLELDQIIVDDFLNEALE